MRLHDQASDDGFPPRYIRGDIGDAPGLSPGDRGCYRLLTYNLPQRAFRRYLAGGLVEGRSLWLSLCVETVQSEPKTGNRHENWNFLQSRLPRCGEILLAPITIRQILRTGSDDRLWHNASFLGDAAFRYQGKADITW